MTDVASTLAAREKTYGAFRDIARISGALQRTMQSTKNWESLPEDAREALQTIASKIARILNGDPEYVDSWHDIAGYATLVERRLIASDAKIAEKVAALQPPPLATPPEGYATRFAPAGDVLHPWLAWRIDNQADVREHRGATRDEALDAAQRG